MIRNTPNLREKFDVLIFPPVGGSAQTIVNGMPRRGDAIPWKASALTPNFGMSPDQTDDMRGGMTVTGVANLQKFVEEGGLFITIGSSVSSIPIDYGITTGVTIQPADKLQARGSIYNATFRIARARSLTATTLVCRSTSARRRCSRSLPEAVVAAGWWRWRRWSGRRRADDRVRQDAAASPIRTSSRRCRNHDPAPVLPNKA